MAKDNQTGRKHVWFNVAEQKKFEKLHLSQPFPQFVRVAFYEKIDRMKKEAKP